MLGVFGDRALEEGASLGGAFETEEALAKMGPSVDVLRVAFKSGAIAGLGFVELALLEVNVAQLEVVMRLIEMMNLSLEFLDAAAVLRARKFEAASGRSRTAVVIEVVPDGTESA